MDIYLELTKNWLQDTDVYYFCGFLAIIDMMYTYETCKTELLMNTRKKNHHTTTHKDLLAHNFVEQYTTHAQE